MDWGAVLALAAITWLEGLRRVPPDALVLRRVLGARWSVAEPVDFGRTWRLVTWWSPLTLALVVPPGGIVRGEASADRAGDALAGRLDACRHTLAALRILGALVLTTVVAGVPAAVGRYGAWGFVAAVVAALLLSLLTAIIAIRGVRRLRVSRWHAVRVGMPLLWPFAAPRAAVLLTEHANAGAPPLAIARRLLGADDFAAWVRPRAFDALSSTPTADGLGAALLSLIGRPALDAIVQTSPPGCASGERYCARCGRVYRASTARCADCGDVALSSPGGS